MRTTTVVAIAILASACGGTKAKTGTAPGSTVIMDPLPPASTPPAVEAGYTRIDHLDLDVKLPDGATVDVRDGVVQVTAPGCSSFTVDADWPYPDLAAAAAAVMKPNAFTTRRTISEQQATTDGWKLVYGGTYTGTDVTFEMTQVARKVGAMRVACLGTPGERSACMEPACASLRVVPGGTAERPFPDGMPVIDVASNGGIDGGSRGGFRIWADGRVHYHAPGATCPKWRGRLGTLTPAKVAELVASAEKAKFFQMKTRFDSPSANCIGQSLTVRNGAQEHTSSYDDCSEPASKALAELIQAITRAVAHPDAC